MLRKAASSSLRTACRALLDDALELGSRCWRDGGACLASSSNAVHARRHFSASELAAREVSNGAGPDEAPGQGATEADVGGQRFHFETGRLSPLSAGACLVRVGDTQVLATAEVAPAEAHVHRRQHFALPLQVDFRQRPSASGRALTGYQRREMASEQEMLAAAVLRRALAPHFPPGFFRALQVSAAVLSADGVADPLVLAINAASAALMCSHIPWAGPVAAVRVARLDGELVVNPPVGEADKADLSLLYAGVEDAAVMLDLQAREVGEEALLEALSLAHAEAAALLGPQLRLARAAGRPKQAFPTAGADAAAAARVREQGRTAVLGALQGFSRARDDVLAREKATLLERLRASGFFRIDALRVPGSGCVSPMDLDHAWGSLVRESLREEVFADNLRPDGRGLVDVRPLEAQPGALPATHGSALLAAGDTQLLSTLTVSAGRSEQPGQCVVHLLSPQPPSERLHRNPSLANQADGMFVERALEAVLPPAARFPFKLRANVDVLAADGSLAEHAVTACSAALQAASIPMARPLAGVSVGLITDAERSPAPGRTAECPPGEVARFVQPFRSHEFLTDMQAIEEQVCDTRLATAGSSSGLVAAQLECAIPGVPLPLLAVGLQRAKAARLKQLGAVAAMVEAGEQGTRVGTMRIPKDQIGRLLGPAGSVLKGIEERSGARLALQDDGLLHFFAPSARQFADAKRAVGSITGATLEEGEVYSSKVVKLLDYGAFVELPNGHQALLHISEMALERVRSVEDVLSVGQEVDVLCQGRDSRGFVKLSRKALLGDAQQQD